MSRLAAFLALPARRRRLVALALALTVAARVGLATASFRRTGQAFASVPAATAGVSAAEIRWATTTAADQLPGTTCLPRALVAHTLCGRYGHEASVYLGVDRDAADFAAHSWVESGDEVVVGGDVDLERYETLGVVAA